METTLNLFDLIFISATVIFLILAFFRGFVKEFFALMNWILSMLLTYWMAPFAARFFNHYTSNKLIANIASSTILFIFIFIIIGLAANKLTIAMQDRMPSTMDKVLGVFYGIFKTLLVFGLVYSLTINFYAMMLPKNEKVEEATELKTRKALSAIERAEEKVETKKTSKVKEKVVEHKLPPMPVWLEQARCRPVIAFSGEMIDPLIKGTIKGVIKNFKQKPKRSKNQALDDKIDEIVDEENPQNETEHKKAGGKNENKGYSKKEIEKMNRLIEIVE